MVVTKPVRPDMVQIDWGGEVKYGLTEVPRTVTIVWCPSAWISVSLGTFRDTQRPKKSSSMTIVLGAPCAPRGVAMVRLGCIPSANLIWRLIFPTETQTPRANSLPKSVTIALAMKIRAVSPLVRLGLSFKLMAQTCSTMGSNSMCICGQASRRWRALKPSLEDGVCFGCGSRFSIRQYSQECLGRLLARPYIRDPVLQSGAHRRTIGQECSLQSRRLL